MALKKAKRQKIKIPVLLTGPSGSGKTLSALMMAKGIVEKMYPDMSEVDQWEKIAIIDSEHERSLLYADNTIADTKIGEFLHYDLKAPFSVERYEQAFKECKEAGVEVIITDSISHAWSGLGGILDAQQEAGGRFQDWRKVKPLEENFLKMLVESGVHTISTARTKQDYAMQPNELGKVEVVKLGLKVEQKDSLEYEFAVVLRLDMNNVATASKDNSNLFKEPFRITKETGHELYDWAEAGIDKAEQEEKERQSLLDDLRELIHGDEARQSYLKELETKADKSYEEFPKNLLEKAIKLVKEYTAPVTPQETDAFNN
ncbi:AAA family ATPase [Macrococcus brunensis]|uniref:AAA family ATPase n=1 Tax=Macrococcus brunensis TaxID=198483 RepID=UPI001EF0353D|nr:AAA family ATPase [Macrococcus brunensis]ULG73191.1 ATP-binding protein [Macrococcus brunensis]